MNKICSPSFVGFSILWVVISSFLYFDNLVHYPKSYVEHFELAPVYDCFGYVDDAERKEEALAYAKSHGHGAEAQVYLNMGLRFVKPVFSLSGYLKLLFMPLLFVLIFRLLFWFWI